MDQGQPNRPPAGQLPPAGYPAGQHDIPVYGGGLQHQQHVQYGQQPQQPFVPYGLPHQQQQPAPFQVGPSQQQKQQFGGPHYGSPSPYGAPRPAPHGLANLGGAGPSPLGAHQFDPRLAANSPAHHLLNLSVPQPSLPQQQQQQQPPALSAYAPRAQLPPQQHHNQHSPPHRGGDDDYVPDDDDRGAAALLAQVANQHNQAQQGVAPPRRESSARSGGSRWTQEEDDKLIEAIKEDPPLNWSQIGEKLGKRSQVCGQRWYNHLSDLHPGVKRVEPNGKVPRGMIYKEAASSDSEPEEASSPEPVEKVTRGPLRRWAGEDDEALKVAYAKHGGETEAAWTSIATDVGHNRTWRACRQRWNTHHKPAEEEDEEEEFLVEGEAGVEGDLQVEGGEQVEGDDDFEMEDDDEVEGDADWDEDAKGPAPKPKKTAASRLRPKASGVKGKHTFTPAGQSPVFLPAEALVAKPPIPFTPTSVIRGRRTLAEEELKGKLFSPSGKVKKVHTCPAENCNAAFKRSEHLKRHYRSVHMGSKPFPCQMTGCTKSFSRKDNLQQHMAMVHSQRAIKLDEPLEDGTTHRYEPIEDQPPKKRAAAGAVARRGPAKPRKAKAKAASEDGEDGSGEGGDDAEGEAEGEGGSAAPEGEDNVDPALTAGDNAPAASTSNADAATTDGGASAGAATVDITPSTAEAQAHFNENDFLKQLQAMEATALAEAKQTDGEETAAAASSSLQFVPPPPPVAEAGDVQVDLEVGGGGKRAREEDGGEEGVEQAKKQRIQPQDGDIAVGGGDIEVPSVEGAEGDGSYERTRV